MTTRRTMLGAVAGGVGLAIAGVPDPATAHHPPGRNQQLLIRGGRLLTMNPTDPVGAVGDVLVTGNRITRVAPSISPRRNMTIIEAAGMVVMPGWVNNHQHLWPTLFRGLSVNHTFTDYFTQVLLRLSPLLTPRHVYVATLVGALDQVYNGTTSVLDWNHTCRTRAHAEAAVQALADSGIRAWFGYASPADRQAPDGFPGKADVRALASDLRHHKLVNLHIGTRNPESADRAGLERIADDIKLAREHDATASFHTGFGNGHPLQLQRLDNLARLGPDVTLVHGNLLSEADLDLVADRGAGVSSTPKVEQLMGFGQIPLRLLLQRGIHPTVGSDVVTVARSDIPGQLEALLMAQRAADHAEDPNQPPLLAGDLLPYGNINPAASLGVGDRVGMLMPGMEADIVLINTRLDLNLTAAIDLKAALVLLAHPQHVDTVIVDGRILSRGGQVLGHDLPALCQELQAIQQQLLDQAGL